MRRNWPEILIIAIIIFMIGMMFWNSTTTRDSFKEECQKVEGKAVWDGRQWVCLHPPKGTSE